MKKFDFARDALKYLIQEFKIKKLHIPYYLCDVIRHIVFKENCKPIFYHIDNNFLPLENFSKNDFILYPNYFGICENNVGKLIKEYPNIIIDNAHSFYSDAKGFASFNSAKKFLPVKKGAYLWLGENKNPFKKDFKRKEKFLFYHNIYKKTNLLNINISKNDIPFCYPYLAENIEIADNIVKNLNKQGLIIYRYWNNLPKNYNEYKFYSRLVPIPLD